MDATPWYYNNELWNDLSPKFNTSYHWNIAGEDISMIVDLLKLKPGAAVLDLGCGQGRHSLELAKRDFVVTALDRNPFFLDFVLKKSEELNVEILLVKSDMKTFIQPEAFDLILNMGFSFGYFEEQSDNLQVLKNIHGSLRPTGACLFELLGKEVVPKMFVEREWTEVGGTYFLDDRRVENNWSRIINHCKIIKDGVVKDGIFSLTIFSGAEFSAMLGDAGFSKVSLYGDLSGSPYDQHAKKLVAVGIK